MKKALLILSILVIGFTLYRGIYGPAVNDDSELAVGSVQPGEVIGIPDTGEDKAGAADNTTKPASNSTANVSGSTSQSAWPVRLDIPKLDVDARVQYVGVTRKGNMGNPSNFTDVAWYKLGTIPGNLGSAVISGHEDNAAGLDGVFKHLDNLSIGDDVYVIRKDGKRLHFKVVEKKIYPYNLSGPELKRVFTANDASRLNLITCAGSWVESLKTNDKRLVVFTKLVND